MLLTIIKLSSKRINSEHTPVLNPEANGQKKTRPSSNMLDEKLFLEVAPTPRTPIFRKDRHLSTVLIPTEIEYMLKY